MRILTIAVAALAAALLLLSAAHAQSGVFDYDPAEFGTRAAHQCGPFGEALPDGPTEEEIATIFVCEQEADALGYGQQLYLYEDISFTREPAREATASETMSLGFVLGSPVYPFSGSLTQIVCVRISEIMQNSGRNCTEYPQTGAGACFYTDQNVWYCYWVREADGETRYDMPPRSL